MNLIAIWFVFDVHKKNHNAKSCQTFEQCIGETKCEFGWERKPIFLVLIMCYFVSFLEWLSSSLLVPGMGYIISMKALPAVSGPSR